MTDAERDQIDSEAETCVKLCSESIKVLKYLGNYEMHCLSFIF